MKPLPKRAEVGDDEKEAIGFTREDGKCRDTMGDFETEHSYFPTGNNDPRPKDQQKRVRSIEGCRQVCIEDENCTAFHFYLLDPGHYNNCWIWTTSGYSGNGSHKAYCFIKDKDFVLTEADLPKFTKPVREECTIDESLNKQGKNRCLRDLQCSGDRTCSWHGWCQGVSGCHDNKDDDLWEDLTKAADKSDKPKPSKSLNDFDKEYDWQRFNDATQN